MPESERVGAAVGTAARKILYPFLQVVAYGSLATSLFFLSYARAIEASGAEVEGFRLSLLNVGSSLFENGLPLFALMTGFFGLVFFRTKEKLATLALMIIVGWMLR